MKNCYKTVILSTWDDFIPFINQINSDIWIYRGQKDSSWELKSTLERAAEDYRIDLLKLPQIEQGMISEYSVPNLPPIPVINCHPWG